MREKECCNSNFALFWESFDFLNSFIFWDRDEFTNRKEQAEANDTYLLRPGSYLFHEDGLTIEKLK